MQGGRLERREASQVSVHPRGSLSFENVVDKDEPSYLGDALVHYSFPLFLFANNMLAPISLLGPLANHFFLRYVSGDKENEESQARRYGAEDVAKKADFDKYLHERNSFWPDLGQIRNKWTWVVLGCGAAGALADGVVRAML